MKISLWQLCLLGIGYGMQEIIGCSKGKRFDVIDTSRMIHKQFASHKTRCLRLTVDNWDGEKVCRMD